MEYRIVRSILFVVPGREIDHFQAETIIRYTEGLLRQQCFRLLVFDLADTVFMDSAGVGMMIGLYQGMGRCCLYHSHAERGSEDLPDGRAA